MKNFSLLFSSLQVNGKLCSIAGSIFKISFFLSLLLFLHNGQSTAQCRVDGVRPSSHTFPASGGTALFSLLIDGDCRIQIEYKPSWVNVYSSGGIIRVYTSNNNGDARSGKVTVKVGNSHSSFSVHQSAGSPPYIKASPTALNFPESGGTQSFSISSNVSSINISWSGNVSNAYRSGNKIYVKCQTNTGFGKRSGSVTLTGEGVHTTVKISQDGVKPYITIRTVLLHFSRQGSAKSVFFDTNISSPKIDFEGCVKRAWIEHEKLNIECHVNHYGNERSGLVTISGAEISKSVSITQEATQIKFKPDALQFSVSGGTKSVELISNAPGLNLNWNGNVSRAWRSGNIIHVECKPNNTNSAKNGSVRVYNSYVSETLTVRQDACPTILVNAGRDRSVYKGGQVELEASGNSDYYEWSHGGGRRNPFNTWVNATTTFTVTGYKGGCSRTDKVTITVEVINPGVINPPETVCFGEPIKFTGSAPSGGAGPYSYSWQYSLDNITFHTITGLGNRNPWPSIPPFTGTRFISRVINRDGLNWYSNSVKITYPLKISAGEISGNQTISSEETTTLQNRKSASGGSGSYAYQWQKYYQGSFVNISGATSTVYKTEQLHETTTFRRIVIDTKCGDIVYSNIVKVEVLNPGVINPPETVCFGEPIKFTGSAPSGGTGPYSYSWHYSLDNITFHTITGLGNRNPWPSIPPFTGTRFIRRRVINRDGLNGYSNSVKITYPLKLSAGEISGD